MSLLPRGYLDTTVAIESARADGEAIRYRTIGTGFFIGLDYGDRSTSSAESYRLFLVTNRHVLADRDDLLIRVNTREGAARRVRLALKGGGSRSWEVHPDERVDVAVVLINARVLLEAGMELGYFRPADMAFVSTMKERDIGPGEELFVLGFPMGMSGLERNYVIARSGMIARFDDEILPLARAHAEAIRQVHVRVPLAALERDALATLREVLAAHPGPCDAFLHLECTDESETVLALPASLRVAAGGEIVPAVERVLGAGVMSFR